VIISCLPHQPQGPIINGKESSGSGFTNISDGVFYSGTGNGQLQLINLPTSFSGYKYRCLVDGVSGNENMVRFTNTWNGNAGNDWFVATNWSCGKVPDPFTDVVIPGGITNYPLVNAATTVKSISVHPGALVTVVNGVTLQINGK
jgi:hypothetical protein